MKLIEKVRETAKVLKTLSRKPKRQPPKRLQARVRATTAATADDYEDEEPQTKLTSAFVVVLVLHLVAVGGIYAFNEIKASRKTATVARVVDALQPTSTNPGGSTVAKAPDQTPASTGGTAVSVTPASAGVVVPAAIRPKTYTVKSGDTLLGIAKAFGINVNEIKQANGLSGDGIRQGQILNLTASKAMASPAVAASTERPEPLETKATFKTYTVKSGDRLIFIAKKFSVSQEDLIAFNKIKDPAKLQIGQMLKIPSKK